MLSDVLRVSRAFLRDVSAKVVGKMRFNIVPKAVNSSQEFGFPFTYPVGREIVFDRPDGPNLRYKEITISFYLNSLES